MPKIVDHAQRRVEIADALYRVIARVGLEGASVRAVASEAGWSMGAVRHYFATQDELLQFSIGLQLERVPARIREIVATARPGRARAQRILEMFLALDAERLVESRVWLGVLARAGTDPSLDAIRRRALAGERYVCRGIVCELSGEPWPDDPDVVLPPGPEREAIRLQVFIDGLTVLCAVDSEHFGADEVSTLIGYELRTLVKRLG
ncbi:TetR family transcriptional regulator [Epidermidibacterium keratini]|uniref:TetR family transcriptional regulator n=1 Tax=Epidermidibacterium keratini TaxID=1891644 RepID=A0A7L4YPS5_9ACTN|nr:TetR/AcrR family transcriptional regulator [Epidermidibacterium keratini]QHC01022.1 TetR family transcriptional regulator [Epidermidibacterium keratini]